MTTLAIPARPLDAAALDLALKEAQFQVKDAAWMRAIGRARGMLTAAQIEALPSGSVRILSPRSGNIYVVSPQRCTCQRGLKAIPTPCWHRAAARAAQIIAEWRACPFCLGRMQLAKTIAGEPCYTCTNCAHEHMVAAGPELLERYGEVR